VGAQYLHAATTLVHMALLDYVLMHTLCYPALDYQIPQLFGFDNYCYSAMVGMGQFLHDVHA